MFDTFVDAQSFNGEILLELTRTYPGISIGFITIGALLIAGLIVWAFVSSAKERSEK